MKISEKIKILVVNGTLLIFCDVVEINDAFGWRLEVNRFPLRVVGEDPILHEIDIKKLIFSKIKNRK